MNVQTPAEAFADSMTIYVVIAAVVAVVFLILIGIVLGIAAASARSGREIAVATQPDMAPCRACGGLVPLMKAACSACGAPVGTTPTPRTSAATAIK